jgi:hypothetical protein
MKIYTNMAWPDDPHRTGQQLYRRPAPRLAAFTAGRAARVNRMAPTSAAVVYLPLHRTQALAVTGQTVAFGFHAASISGEAEAPALAQVADLDLMQARRHAAILAGHLLAGDLAALRALAGDGVLRGVTTVEREWADRSAPVKGRAVMLDCGLDLPGAASLAQACRQALITVSDSGARAAPDEPTAGELAAVAAVERALVIALMSARHLDRYTWERTLHSDEIMAASAWDCFPYLRTAQRTAAADAGVTVAGQPGHGPARTGA